MSQSTRQLRSVKPRKRIPREQLVDLYVNQNLTARQIGSIVGASGTCVHQWMKRYGIATKFAMTPPPKERLVELYVNQRLSAARVGEVLDAAKATVLGWLEHYGIKKRPSGIYLANREGIQLPTKDDLERLIHREFKHYDEIAAIYNISASSVGNLVQKYGISGLPHWSSRSRSVHRSPSLEDLQQLYVTEQWPVLKVAKAFGLTRSAILFQLQKHGITRRQGRIQAKDGDFVRSSYELLVDDWLFDHGFPHIYNPKVPFSKYQRADFLVGLTYIEIWGIEGVPEYDKSREQKTAQYQNHSMQLLEIHAKDFRASRWKEILREHFCDGLLC